MERKNYSNLDYENEVSDKRESAAWKQLVEVKGIEPLAPCMQSRCSPAELHPHGVAVGEGRRRGRLGWLTFPLEL